MFFTFFDISTSQIFDIVTQCVSSLDRPHSQIAHILRPANILDVEMLKNVKNIAKKNIFEKNVDFFLEIFLRLNTSFLT